MIIGLIGREGMVANDLARRIGGFVSIVILTKVQKLVRECMLHGIPANIVTCITSSDQVAACDICFTIVRDGTRAVDGSVPLADPEDPAGATLDYIDRNPVQFFPSTVLH